MKNNRRNKQASEPDYKTYLEEQVETGSVMLPESFKEKMRELLGTEYEAYLESLKQPCHSGLRINNRKLKKDEWEEICPFHIEPVPWISNGYYYTEGKDAIRPSRHPYYYAGLYYLQEPSAMTPASLLPIEPGNRVLDLCAAPGGKSTELGARLQGKGLLFANDISNSRAKALLKNLEMAGIANLCVSSETPEKLSELLPEFFDRILVDAPCSGEGMFRKDPDMVKSYLDRGPKEYVPIQRSIVEEAVKMLRPGGFLLYSTCTFDEEENEGTIRFLLEKYPDMCLADLPQKEGFERGRGLPECVRLFPHRILGEGHFIALLKKKEKTEEYEKKAENGEKRAGQRTAEMADSPVSEFLSHISIDWSPERLYEKNEKIYYLPEGFKEISGKAVKKLRFLRTGLLLGELKKGRFEPSQAFAMALRQEEYPDTVNLKAEDERAIRYLKGETVMLSEDEVRDGLPWTLVCVDGFPLGWAKRTGNNLKNKYYPGWRWQ